MNDLKGQRFGRLIAIMDSGRRYMRKHQERNEVIWLCQCDCGKLKEIAKRNLKKKYTQSCGCLQKERAAKAQYKHGDNCRGNKATLYGAWRSMKTRCFNSNDKKYHRYGGRGIKICLEWLNDYPVFKKWALDNGYESGLSIDRIENNGNYEPNNCQWLTMSEHGKKSRALVLGRDYPY